MQHVAVNNGVSVNIFQFACVHKHTHIMVFGHVVYDNLSYVCNTACKYCSGDKYTHSWCTYIVHRDTKCNRFCMLMVLITRQQTCSIIDAYNNYMHCSDEAYLAKDQAAVTWSGTGHME